MSLEHRPVLLLTGPGNGLDNWEAELALPESQRPGPSDLTLVGENRRPHNVHGIVVGSVVATHLHVELSDGSVEGGVSELLVHVVLAGTRLVLEHDAVGLDEVGALLVDLG